MTHAQLTEKITHLGYQGFKEVYQRQCEKVSYSSMSFEERLYQLLDAQEIFLKNKRIIMNHRLSKIKDKHASLDAIDYRPQRRIDRAQIHSLAQLNFIDARQNMIITGKTGTGKLNGTPHRYDLDNHPASRRSVPNPSAEYPDRHIGRGLLHNPSDVHQVRYDCGILQSGKVYQDR